MYFVLISIHISLYYIKNYIFKLKISNKNNVKKIDLTFPSYSHSFLILPSKTKNNYNNLYMIIHQFFVLETKLFKVECFTEYHFISSLLKLSTYVLTFLFLYILPYIYSQIFVYL